MAAPNDHFEPILLPAVILAGMYERSIVLADGQQVKTYTSNKKEPPGDAEQTAPNKPTAVSARPASEDMTKPKAPPPTITSVSTPAQNLPGASAKPALSLNETGPVWLGKFSRQVLIILHEKEAVHCTDEDLLFLTRVLGAVKLSMDHVAVFNLARQPMSFGEVSKVLPPKVAIFFGTEPAEMQVPMRFPYFQVQPWGGCTFLYAPSLKAMNGSLPDQIQQKRSLWEALQKIFMPAT